MASEKIEHQFSGTTLDHFACYTAIQTSLRALFISHANPEVLQRVFRQEYESAIGLLRLQGASQSAIEAYREFIGGIVPEAQAQLPGDFSASDQSQEAAK